MNFSFFRSLRFQIVFSYLIILVATLTIFSIQIYYNLREILYQRTDSFLILKMEGVEDALRTYWKTQKLEMASDWALAYLFKFDHGKNEDGKFKEIANDLTSKKIVSSSSPSGSSSDFIVNIFDPKGHLVSTSFQYLPSRELEQKMLRGGSYLETSQFEHPQGTLIPTRVLTKAVIDGKDIRAYIQVIASLLPVWSRLEDLKQLIFLRVPFVIVISGLASIFFIRATLKPINKMIRAIREVRSENLARLQVPDTNDEIAGLAETFNEMVGRLEKSFNSQKQIVQDVSHELKTPLTVLKGEIEVTLKKKRTAEEYEGLLLSNQEEVEKMQTIVDNLLILARFDHHDFRLEMKRLDLEKVIHGVIREVGVLAKAKNIQIDMQAKGGISLEGHQEHVHRLFRNLIENAIKYTPNDGYVRIFSYERRGFIAVDVCDNGVGIPVEHLPHVFDRFYRVDNARSGKGFGLGLSIAKSIAAAHKGEIQVESFLGKGSTFRVLFPMNASAMAV